MERKTILETLQKDPQIDVLVVGGGLMAPAYFATWP
jgi:hypothetical protein